MSTTRTRTRTSLGKVASALVVIGIAIVGGISYLTGQPVEPAPAAGPVASVEVPTTSIAPQDVGTALADAQALPLLDQSMEVPEYRRDEFGPAWPDVDGDGCNERQEVLQRDLDEAVLGSDGCTVLTGTLDDPYTGATIDFAHDRVGGDSQAIQIDHVLPLSYAWSAGAWRWTDAERVAFANDMDNLLAADGPANASKSDSGPGEWMPDDVGSWCSYAASWTSIATEYDLAVTVADRSMLVDVLEACA